MFRFIYSELNVNDLQMKELQDQLEAENYFSVRMEKAAGADIGSAKYISPGDFILFQMLNHVPSLFLSDTLQDTSAGTKRRVGRKNKAIQRVGRRFQESGE